MFCPECEKEGKTSKVYPRGGTSTAMFCAPFYEKGVYHNHDMNTTTWGYSCSNNHIFHKIDPKYCPAKDCNWNKQ